MSFVDYLSFFEYSQLDSIINGVLLYVEGYVELNSVSIQPDEDDINEPGYVYAGAVAVHILKAIPTIVVFFYRAYRIHIKLRALIRKMREERERKRNK